jgi:hypothetical protein
VRSTAAPYTESRLTRSVANERVGFPVVEQLGKLDRRLKGRLRKRDNLLKGTGGKGGVEEEEPRKPGPQLIIQYSL